MADAGHSRRLEAWARLAGQKSAVLGGGFFLVILTVVLFGPLVWTLDPQLVDIQDRNAQMSLDHPLGTDQLGRDMLARMMEGGRASLAVGVAAMLLSLAIGGVIGILAGFVRWLDGVLMRLTDLFLALPLLPLVLVIILLFRDTLRTLFGQEAGIFMMVVVVIGITSWMQTARVVRGEVLTLRERDFVTAARSVGTPPRRIVRRHILPNVLSPMMVSATLGIANAIITESALSFLGLGFPSDFATWGRLLFDATDYLQQYPGRVMWPGIAISLTVLSVNYLGDGLRDSLDPRISHRGRRRRP